MASREGVFAAGDMRRGQSLVVWAISEVLNATAVHAWLAAREPSQARTAHAAASAAAR